MELKTEIQTRKLLPKTYRRIVLELGQGSGSLTCVVSPQGCWDDPLVLKILLKRFFSDFLRQSVYCLGSESSAFSWVLDGPTLSSVFCVVSIGTQTKICAGLWKNVHKVVLTQLATPAEDSTSIPSTHVRQLTAIWNLNSKKDFLRHLNS